MLKLLGGGIADHEVGAGKSLIMCITSYELKRLGLVHKPMLCCLKNNAKEIADVFQTAYPDAKILFPSENDFAASRRKRMLNEMKNND